MIILNMPRRSGKTSKLIKYALKNSYDILVFSNLEKDRLLRAYPELNKDQVFIWQEIPKRRANRRYYGTVVDNLDFILHQQLPNKVRAIGFGECCDIRSINHIEEEL